MLIHYVGMNMYIMKISLKLRRCLIRLLIWMSGIIVLGGGKEILLINKKNMIELPSHSRELFKSILKIQFCTHLWV